MTSDKQQFGGGTDLDGAIVGGGRRRMAGYQPQAVAAPNGEAKAVKASGPPQGAVKSVEPAAVEQAAAPVRKTRMEAPETAPAASQRPEPHDVVASSGRRRMGPPEATPPVDRQRMGQLETPTPAGRQRMGRPGALPSGTASRQRMGSAGASDPVTASTDALTVSGARARIGAPAAAAPKTSQQTGPASSTAAASYEKPWPRWVRPIIIMAGILALGLVFVLGARWLRELAAIQEFIATYNGHASQPDVAPAGIPAWLGWQHFLNMFFIVLIVRTGLQVRNERKPPAYWIAKKNSFFSPSGAKPKKVSLTQWLHQSLDVFWLVNGLIFVVLLIVTDHWMRIVPTSWDIFPNMLSGAIQYASLDWPTENGWVHYNALQVMAYFVTVFIAAPLAIISGIRISTWWPDQNARLNKIYPVEVARAIHFPVMLYFVVFTIAHVFLVFFTGALRNLNHMYTSRDVVDWWGLVIFLASLLVIAGAWFLTQPLFMRPVAAKTGQVSK